MSPVTWMVRLSGAHFDLQTLAALFPSSDLRIEQDNEQYFLKSAEFGSLTTEAEVHARAETTLQTVNGIGKLNDPNFVAVGIDAVAEIALDGSRRHHVRMSANITARSRLVAHAVAVKRDGGVEPDPQQTFAEVQFAAAIRNTKVAKALRLLGARQLTWHNLNNILEVVQSDVGGEITKAGWASQADLDRFTQTANSTQAIGDDARHGHEKVPPPKNPILLAEAGDLIRRIVKNWSESKPADKA